MVLLKKASVTRLLTTLKHFCILQKKRTIDLAIGAKFYEPLKFAFLRVSFCKLCCLYITDEGFFFFFSFFFSLEI